MATIRINNSGAIRMVTRSVQSGIADIMADVFDESQRQVPVDTGRLKESATININEKSISIQYNTPYALIQHENLEYNHPNGGKAKYLEDAFNSIVPGARTRIQSKVNSDLGG